MRILSCFPNKDMLDFWIKNNLNVLFHGKHGIGKTSMILDSFNRNGIKYKQFSAATMDPWVDFIGVPKENKDEKGSYLELVLPKSLRENEIEALFFDELNRSHKKVRNAVMELIQFKSINGRKFPNLRFVWAAINPEENEELEYDVEKLDPAQADRFQVHIEIPYKPHPPFFRLKYGTEVGSAAIDWWNELNESEKNAISPRRLEYAIEMFNLGGNLSHILPLNSNPDKLNFALKNGSPIRHYKKLIANAKQDKSVENEIRIWLNDENNFSAVKEEIQKDPSHSLHFVSEERIVEIISKNKNVSYYVFNNYEKFKDLINNLHKNSQNSNLKKQAATCVKYNLYKKTESSTEVINRPTIKLKDLSACHKRMNKHISKKGIWNDQKVISFSDFNTVQTFFITDTYTMFDCLIELCNSNKNKFHILNSAIKIVKTKKHLCSPEECEDFLSILNYVLSCSQVSALPHNVKDINPSVNICVDILRNSGRINTVKDFVDKWSFITGKLVDYFSVLNSIINTTSAIDTIIIKR